MEVQCMGIITSPTRRGERCSLTATMDGFCRQHHPNYPALQKAKRNEAYANHRARQRRNRELLRFAPHALRALRLIAAGGAPSPTALAGGCLAKHARDL